MAVQPFRVKLDRSVRRMVLAGIVAANLAFTATTVAFILLWSRIDDLSPRARWLTRYVLVQGHLATENVIAAWYSSMLLLAVAGMALLAWMVERRQRIRLRSGWLVFALLFGLLSLDEIGSLHERIGMIPLVDGRAFGWIYVLVLPILAVGAFMAAFAWTHLRRVPITMILVIAGVVMFLLDPVLESIEMAMIHGAGAVDGTWQRSLHDVLLIVEEGGLELFGILSFLAATIIYVAREGGDVIEWTVESRIATVSAALITLTLGCGVFGAGSLVSRLPAGDTGIAANWFPAVAWMLVAAAAMAQPASKWGYSIAAAAVLLSALFGAGLYMYAGWLASRAAWVAPLAGVLTAGIALEAALNSYRLIFSPRSSIASPTLRRPRPNPS